MQLGEKEKYLTPEFIEMIDISGEDLANLLPNLNKEQKEVLSHFNEKKTLEIIVSCNEKIREKMIDLLDQLDNSNSGELRRVKEEMAVELLQLDVNDYDKVFKEIENIYLTSNLPTVGKTFLVFQKLHPEFLGEQIEGVKDASIGNIPSLKNASYQERKRHIFSNLLMCSLQSNDRNLKDYIHIIEEGNKLYEQSISEGKNIDEFGKDDKEILEKYRDILNTLYIHTAKGKKSGLLDVTGNLESDLKTIYGLFGQSRNSKKMPDKIIRLFCPFSGIRTLEDVKKIMKDSIDKAEKRAERIENGQIPIISEGDFVKGVKDTQYFYSMLQNGILAKDFLGANAHSDGTPLDMDVEKVITLGKSLSETLSKLNTAKSFTSDVVSGKKLGKIFLVFDKDEYIETRDSNNEVNEENVYRLKQEPEKREVFCNGDTIYGIGMGDGSSKIKAIITDKYVDKLGLIIAINSPTYIPIVNEKEEIIFTKDMYNEIRSKMQGLSHYEENEFILDKTAKNSQTMKIIELVDSIQENAKHKREIILGRLNEAVKKAGFELSDKRLIDLLPGFIEFIDTGSTGRGTNEPGDGDFDFMVRMDRKLSKAPDEFKKYLKDIINEDKRVKKAETTGKGDFRYKGVHFKELNGIDIDLDLTFTTRTNEIEYSTDECINDRLNTIRKRSEENYKYVIANILLAKKMMKMAGSYKKKDAASPENGEPDTRGGLGGVGIENWILQNGGSFERAARTFMDVANKSKNLAEFQQNYPIWDFGENHVSTYENIFSHDNFVFNLNEAGYDKMTEALKKYLKNLDEKKIEDEKIGIQDIVMEDPSVLEDSLYIKSVEGLLNKKLKLEEQEIMFNN